MTDFDQLIKEKADSAHYKYKASAWKHLASQAGFKVGLSGLQIALVSIALVTVVGGAIFIFTPKETAPAPTPQQVVSSTTHLDTAETQSQDAVAEHHQPSQQKTADRPAQDPEPDINDSVAAPQQKVLNQKSNSKTKQYNYRPIRINVDTISEDVPTNEQLRRCNSNL